MSPLIRRGVQLGAGSIIMAYVVVGEYSVIGAGSVVTRDVPPYSIVLGNPARLHGAVDQITCNRGFTDRPYHACGNGREAL